MRLGRILRATTAAAWLCLATAYAAPAQAGVTVDLGGRPVDGSTDKAHPADVEAGVWSDTLGSPGSGSDTHYFTYHRTMAGSTVHISVVAQPADASNGDEIEFDATSDGNDCGSEDATSSFETTTVFGVSGSIPSSDADASCSTASSLDIAVDRGTSSASGSLPYALKIVEEAPANETGKLPDPVDTVSYHPVKGSGGDQVIGAHSFDDAPMLKASGNGTTVTTTLTEGGEQLWRVPVAWGQQVSAVAAVPAMDAATQNERPFGPTLDLSLLDPMHCSIGDAPSDGGTSVQYGDTADSATIGSRPVDYRNRESDYCADVPGDYWIDLSSSPPDGKALQVPVTLTVTVSGSPGGAPAYYQTVQSPDHGDGPSGYSPKTPFLVGEGRFSAVASGDPGPPWWRLRHELGLGLAALSLASCAAGVLLVRRRAARR